MKECVENIIYTSVVTVVVGAICRICCSEVFNEMTAEKFSRLWLPLEEHSYITKMSGPMDYTITEVRSSKQKVMLHNNINQKKTTSLHAKHVVNTECLMFHKHVESRQTNNFPSQ